MQGARKSKDKLTYIRKAAGWAVNGIGSEPRQGNEKTYSSQEKEPESEVEE